MVATKSTLFVAGLCAAKYVVAQSHGDEGSRYMGPVAFMWPPDREWGAAQDNTAPCGSAQGVTNRTEFPLLNGQISLVAQDESWGIEVSISYKDNPTSNNDFETIIQPVHIPELAEGHMCYPVPNPPADIEARSNATLQIKYISDFDDPDNSNDTFYACADITYVPTSQFTFQVPCFNATVDDFGGIVDTNSTSSGTAAGAAATSTGAPSVEGSSSSGLSKGAIAGIVVGVVLGAFVILGGLFLMWRRSQRKKRAREQEANLRSVKWDEHTQGATGSEASDRDIALRQL